MSENIGCGIIYKNEWFQKHSNGCRNRIFGALGLTVEEKEPAILTYEAFTQENQLAILPLSEEIELWIGWPVTQLIDGTDRHYAYPSYWTALFLSYDTGSMSFADQYFNQGVIGGGGDISGATLKVWQRYFKTSSNVSRVPQEFEFAVKQITETLETTEELAKRVQTGFIGKGRYGMAFHPDKQIWVMARREDDGESFIELNPRSYKKKGKVFARTAHTSGYSFLSQIDMFNEYYQHAIAYHIGCRFDALEDGHEMFSQPALIYATR